MKCSFNELSDIMQKLTSPGGCPWDNIQTHESIRQNLIEEAYEVIDAIDNADFSGMCEELGDVMMLIMLHAMIATKNGEFTLDDVIDGISQKMIRRHPHVFADTSVDSVEQILDNWEDIKKDEKGYKSVSDKMRRVPLSLPALMRAQKVIEKTEQQEDLITVSNSVESKVSQLVKVCIDGKKDILAFYGDALLELAKLGALLELNAEFALTKSTTTFINKQEIFELSEL